MRIVESAHYNIYIGKESLLEINLSNYSNVAILVDNNTKEHCLPLFLTYIKDCNNPVVIELPAGEQYKNYDSCRLIWKELLKNNFDRNSLLINLGGGVVGDIGGYCASTYKRGISFIQVPTTLIAMCDASVGGKLGFNFQGLKNQIGLFNNPSMVVIFAEFLETLKTCQLYSGYAEIIKHILISDQGKWEDLKSESFDNVNWEEKIFDSVKIKNSIVSEDYMEKGIRKKLNFGHTFGHAIESYYISRGDTILHGEAVFMGMIMESEISNISTEEKIDIKNYILSNFELPYFPNKSDLIQFMLNDKKNHSGKINFSLLDSIGNCVIDQLLPADEI